MFLQEYSIVLVFWEQLTGLLLAPNGALLTGGFMAPSGVQTKELH